MTKKQSSTATASASKTLRRGQEKFIIIDSNALIHRAFHALPPLATKDGQIVNAVYGFALILLKILKDLKPNYIAATFDLAAKTFRHKEFEEYKAQRVKQPDELYEQIPVVKELLAAFNIPIFAQAGFEADDVIGTIAHLKSVDRPDIESIIVTGDRDTLQLVDDNTVVLSPHKGFGETITYDEKAVVEKYGGLKPEQLIDYKALCGDPSDNIPGVRGIGPKGAIDLIKEFETLEELYRHLDSKKIKDRTRELLKQYETDAKMSQRLAKIILDVPIKFNLADCRFTGFDQEKVVALFQKLNFKKLLGQLITLDKKQIVPAQNSLFLETNKSGTKKIERKINQQPARQNYQTISNEGQTKKFLSALKQQTIFCFDTETTSTDPFVAKLLGISFCWEAGEAYYLPITLLKNIVPELAEIFSDKKIKKIGHNLKYDLEVMTEFFWTSDSASSATQKEGEEGEINGLYFDTMIASYLLNPGQRQHNLDTIAFVELGYQMQPIEELIGSGKKQISMADVPIEKVGWYSCEDADMTFRLYEKFVKELADENLFGVFEKIDLPLVAVLAQIEKNGVKIDTSLLKKLSQEFAKKIKAIEKKVYTIVGAEFNLASPLQLKEILFEKLGISSAGLAKTKTGISTGAAELEKLAFNLRENGGEKKHLQLIDLLLEFRELSKLKSTYLDALPELVSAQDGRLHTSFNQTVTATGRLSSSEPNLQNIPIRTETGQQIRKAFVAQAGYKFIKADYSQIELRIVASLANDKKMLAAFNDRVDIHTQTAALVNNIKISEVTPALRRQAKEINFGVLYGMGAWGLAQRTDLSHSEAQKFIAKYFENYSGVREYIDNVISLAKETGYVETFYGRRRYLPDINSGIQQVQSAAERMAINAPIQGTAADLIKLAMIEIYCELPKISPDSKMILQVHDELVFEVPEKEVKKVAQFVQEKMNSVYKLRAPIATDVSVGDNWGETEKIN